MVKDYSDSERGNSLLPHGLFYLISSKGSFHLHQLWSTDWNEKKLNGSTMSDLSDYPSHHEWMQYHRATFRSRIMIFFSVLVVSLNQ